MAPIAASLAKVGGNTLISRILGFVRDLVVARVFGADAATDAFFVAFRIPNLMRRLFAEGAFSLAFVPVLSEYRTQRGPAELRRFVDDTAGTLGLALLVVTVLGILGAPLLVLAFAPGFADDPGQRVLAADMLRLTFPYLLFISLTALAGGILNTFGRFGVPAFTPVLLNLVLIACALWLAPQMERPIVALAWGVLIAGVVQLAFQVPFLARLGLLPRPRFNPRDPGVRRMLGLIGPSLLGVSVAQINMLLSTLLASFLAAGSISWLYYADRLMEFPLGVLGVALGTVMLPKLSQGARRTDSRRHSPAPWTGPCAGSCCWGCRRPWGWPCWRAPVRHPVLLGCLRRQRRAHGRPGPDRLWVRGAGLPRGQDPGPGLLRPPADPGPGADRHGLHAGQPGPEPGPDVAPGPCRAGPGDDPGGPGQRGAAVAGAAPGEGVYRPRPAGPASGPGVRGRAWSWPCSWGGPVRPRRPGWRWGTGPGPCSC